MKKILIMFVVALFSANTYARDNIGVYAGLGGTSSLTKLEDSLLKNTVNMFVGYDIMKYLAVEAEYMHGLEAKNSSTTIETLPGGAIDTSHYTDNFSSSTLFTNFVGKYPILANHIIFAKLGIGYATYQNKYTSSYTIVGPGSSSGSSSSGVATKIALALKIGTGYEYALTKKHSLIVNYNYVTTSIKNGSKDLYHHAVGGYYKFTF